MSTQQTMLFKNRKEEDDRDIRRLKKEFENEYTTDRLIKVLSHAERYESQFQKQTSQCGRRQNTIVLTSAQLALATHNQKQKL